MWLVRASLKNPYAVVVMALAIIVIGVTSVQKMPLDILPQFKTPAVQILTLYPGMPTELMERDITNRLERWTSQSMGIAYQESRSMVGVSVVRDYFREDIDPNTAMSQVSALAISDLYYLPPGTIPPMTMLFDPTATLPLALVACSSESLDEAQVYDIAYFEMRNLLSGTQGVIAPAVFGGKLRRIYVYVDKDKLQARGLSPLDVVNSLTQFNIMIPTGNAKIGDMDYAINAEGMVEKVEELNDIPIKISAGSAGASPSPADGTRQGAGAPVLIRDIGRAEDTNAIQTNVVRISRPPDWKGRRQVYIPVFRQPGSNSIAVVEGTKETIEKGIKPRVPKEMNIDVVGDQTVFIRKAIHALQKEGILGVALAAAMILLFIGSVRSTLAIIIAVPISLLTGLIGLYYTGNTINAMTLGGLALAIGPLIDLGVVVLENTDRHLHLGRKPADAAVEGAGEVALPVLVATVATIVVFFPVTFLSGIGKFLFTPLAMAVGFAMAGAYVMAMTLVPAYCANFLRMESSADILSAGRRTRNPLVLFQRGFERLRDRYVRGLRWALRHKALVLIGAGVAFVLSLFLYPLIGQELFPQMDAGQLTVQVRLPSGTRIEKTEEVIADVEKVVQEIIPEHDREIMISNLGVLYDWPAAYTPNGGPHDGFILVQLPLEGRRTSVQTYADRLRKKLNEQFPGVQFSFNTGGIVTAALNFGLPSPIDIQVEGKSLETLHEITRTIREVAKQVPGAVDVRIQQEIDYPQINVKVDRIKAAYLGLTQDEVVKNIVTALNSSTNFKPAFWLDYETGKHYFIGATYRERDINSFETLENIPITSPKQRRPVLLKNIATFERATVPTEVAHHRIRRVMDVFVNVSGRDVGSVAADIERAVKKLNIEERHPGYFVRFRGEVASMRESFGSLGFAFILAVILIYLVMVALFQSFIDPFIILLSVPLGLIGVLAILWATGTTLNVQSFMGVIFLVGIAVSNTVLVVDFANRARARGLSAQEAVLEAGAARLRPVLMTALAAMLALTPMALQTGEATLPLARAVIGGLSVATLVTLFVVPVLYALVKRDRG